MISEKSIFSMGRCSSLLDFPNNIRQLSVLPEFLWHFVVQQAETPESIAP
jgi:hypothetical protein